MHTDLLKEMERKEKNRELDQGKLITPEENNNKKVHYVILLLL